MASLRSYLPPAGGTVWRNERRLRRTSSSGEDENGLSRTRIKHIVIREVWKRDVPLPYALYKIDVMTQSNHWFILRRYREFHSLHLNLVKQYNIPSDMLPAKKLFSNMSLAYLEKRRNALEHYLQRLINSHHDIAESHELFQFLNVQTHDVLCVTRQLAKILEKHGRNILARGGGFTFSPTQMYCITRQLQLPHVAIEESDTSNPGDEIVDLGYLYGFIQELRSLCVSGVASRSSLCQELISNQAFDISLFKSLQKLQIDKCHISVIDGLFRIQKQLTHVTLRNCLESMKEFLVDSAMQKRAIKQASSNVESWRNMSTTKLTDNRVVVRPWILLTHINMSHNNISTLDHSLKLLPALEQLDLSLNEFVHLDLEQLTSSTLTFLNLSHNQVHYVSATSRDLRNLKSLLLTNNKLENLEGVECLRGLVELDVRYNDIKGIDELAKISSLLHLRILALTGNPCVASKSYRIHAFCQLKARELILDGIKITESEKAKVHLAQGRKFGAKTSEGEQSSTPSTSAETESNQDVKKKVVSYIDDDQDSGFGGNYTGSIDEGGLVFDWSCYSNYMQSVAEPFPYHVAGPSASRNDRTSLRSPTPTRIKSSGYKVDQRNHEVYSDDVFFENRLSETETHHGDISPVLRDLVVTTKGKDLMTKFPTTRESTGDISPGNMDYRGKQPTKRFNYKRNTNIPIRASSTLLQLSLNLAASKKDETDIQTEELDHSDTNKDELSSVRVSRPTAHSELYERHESCPSQVNDTDHTQDSALNKKCSKYETSSLESSNKIKSASNSERKLLSYNSNSDGFSSDINVRSTEVSSFKDDNADQLRF